jgi:hypothetical protein
MAYEDLEANAMPIRSAQRGDVAFYDYRQPKLDGNGNPAYDPQGRLVIEVQQHAAVVVEVQQTGLVLLDSNWVADQTIGEHPVTWQDLENTYKFQAADVEKLVGYLRDAIRPPGYCDTDLGDSAVVADLGNPVSEANFNLENWGPINNDGRYTSPSGDKTKRYMRLRQESSLTVSGLLLGVDYELSAEVEDGACDDSFSILANGVQVYRYHADPSPITVIKRHVCAVPSALFSAGKLQVTFRNEATGDCGLAGVYNVGLKPTQ